MNFPKLLELPEFDYVSMDRVLREPMNRLFDTILTFFKFFIFFRLFSLLRCQNGEEEIEFFENIERYFPDESEVGNISITNLRIIWLNPENPSENICFTSLVYDNS
jgi:hypothetical protein